MKIQVYAINGANTAPYAEAASFLKNASSGAINAEFALTQLSNADMPLKYMGKASDGADFWGVDFDFIKALGSTERFTQILYPKPEGSYRMLSCALQTGKEQKQYSQVIAPTIWVEICHEIIHMFYSYLGLPDKLHQTIIDEHQLAIPAFTCVIQELAPYYSQLENMDPLFSLKRRIPTFRAGMKAMRSYGLHNGQDYVARYEPLYAHEDCTATKGHSPRGGNLIYLNGAHYKLMAAHLSKYVKTGQVRRGEQVAVTGNTGTESTGPHLHLEAFLSLTGERLDPEKLPWDEEKTEDMLIKKQGSPEVAYLSAKRIRHPMSERAFVEYFDSVTPEEVTEAQYNAYPTGRPIFFTVNFGAAEVPENIWEAEKSEVVE